MRNDVISEQVFCPLLVKWLYWHEDVNRRVTHFVMSRGAAWYAVTVRSESRSAFILKTESSKRRHWCTYQDGVTSKDSWTFSSTAVGTWNFADFYFLRVLPICGLFLAETNPFLIRKSRVSGSSSALSFSSFLCSPDGIDSKTSALRRSSVLGQNLFNSDKGRWCRLSKSKRFSGCLPNYTVQNCTSDNSYWRAEKVKKMRAFWIWNLIADEVIKLTDCHPVTEIERSVSHSAGRLQTVALEFNFTLRWKLTISCLHVFGPVLWRAGRCLPSITSLQKPLRTSFS